MKNNVSENTGNADRRTIRYQLAGWILFVLCAIFFMASSLKNFDVPAFIGSLIFFAACIVFLIPLIRAGKE